MEYVMNTTPVIANTDRMKFFKARNKVLSGEILTEEEMRTILDFYVGETRNALSECLGVDIENDPLTNRCDLAQKLMGNSLEKIGVTVYPQETQNTITSGVPGHSFLVAIFNGNSPFLVDITYRQFFTKEKCNVERLSMCDDLVVTAPDPGFFAASKEVIKKTAIDILEHGYTPLTAESAKHYGDTFYFAKVGRGGYSNIPGYVYLNSFLKENHVYAMKGEVGANITL